MKWKWLLFVIASLALQGVAISYTSSNSSEVYFTPSLDCENKIIHHINHSNKIDIAVYSITNQNIVNAIKSAHQKGTKIRIISDRLQSKGKYSKIKELQSTGIEVRLNKKHKIEHNKFAIFNNTHIVTGSYNWTTSATHANSENCYFTTSKTERYKARFEYLWNLYSHQKLNRFNQTF